MIRVINISSRTIELAGVDIKPHTGHDFEDLSILNRQRVVAMSAVGLLKAYEVDHVSLAENENITTNEVEASNDIVKVEKPAKKSNKKK